MAQVYSDKQQIQIEQVHLVYKPKTDSIFITSSDDDLINEDFFFEAEKGTELESALREILKDHGLISLEISNSPHANTLKHEIELNTKQEKEIINQSIKKILRSNAHKDLAQNSVMQEEKVA